MSNLGEGLRHAGWTLVVVVFFASVTALVFITIDGRNERIRQENTCRDGFLVSRSAGDSLGLILHIPRCYHVLFPDRQ